MTQLLALLLAAQSTLLQGRLPRAPTDAWDVRWSKQLVARSALEWKPREPGGPAVDPLTRVVVAGTRDGVLRALAPDGRVLWEFRAGAGFPAPARIAQDTVYVGSSDGRVYALDLVTGAQRWRYAVNEEVGTTPAVSGGALFVSTLGDTLVALDAATGAFRWHHRREAPQGFTLRGAAAPVAADGAVYAAFADGVLVALDAATGRVRWERRVSPQGRYLDVDSTPVLHGGRLHVASFGGAVVAVDAATGVDVWTAKIPGAARVALSGEVLVAVTTAQLVGLLPEDGTVLWTTPLEGAPTGEPSLAGDRLLVPTGRGLLAIDPATGRRLVELNPGTGVSAAAAVEGSRVYVLSNGGALVALDLK
jgi:outer membrane protein assembly factor BamB